MNGRDQALRLVEIYPSIQGESTFVGLPCTFVRVAGCNLRCTWCDSTFTFTGGEWRTLDEVVAEVERIGLPLVELTGGEPLVHRAAVPLMQRLVDGGFTVLLETSGSRDISTVPRSVHVILDFKPPDSGEARANLWSNVEHLKPIDEVKFVVASRRDFDWSVEVVARHGLGQRCTVLFSPAWGLVAPRDLVAWMLEARVPGRLSLQAHKVIWPPDQRGV